MSKEIFKQILITLLLVAISTTLYSQTAYYWSGGRQINMTINNNKYFIVSNKADSTAVKNELQNVLTISPFKPFQIGAVQNNATNTMNSKCWAIVETSSPINIPSNSSIDYITPHFTLSDSTTVGISNLFYVKLRNLSDTLKLDSISNLYNVTRIGYYSRMPLWWTMGCTKYSTGNSLEMANLFYETGLFVSAQPDIMCDIIYDCTNDYFFSSQWGLNNQYYPEYDINYCNVRSITTGSSNIIVAVFDSGIQMDHPDLNNISSVCYNIEDSTNTNVITYPHGTRCAGVIGATSNNNIGIAGICPSSPIISICKGNTGVSVDDGRRIANGFYFALENNASVVNCSWHVAENDFVRNAIDSIVNCGIVVVASASNRGVDSVAFPASMTNVIGVGAIYKDGSRHRYSNYGDSLNVVAPGSNIFTTDLNSGYYDFFEKTSAATPHVSAIAALMRSVNPNLTPAQVKTIIEQTAQRIRNVNTDPINGVYNYTISSDHPNGLWNNQMGYGLVDAHAAVMETYFYDRQILGSNTISPCSIIYPCNGIITYNLNSSSMPSNTTLQWSVSGNLALVSSNNQSISVLPTGIGSGTITISYTHEGYTVTKQKEITIESLPPSSNYYCNYSTTGNMTVSNELYINGTFTINNGHIVTVSCVGFCLPDSKIVVQPGGKLIINDGKLTSFCTDKMWDGIYVVGNKNQRQLAQYQGTVEIKNGSLIENARCAIATWDGSDDNTSGGIVKCSTSTFKNNGRCADFLEYTNHTAANTETNNVSYFSRCNFIADDYNLFDANNVWLFDFIRMQHVKGISISACLFEDQCAIPNPLCYAIKTIDAGYTLKEYCSNPSLLDQCICNTTPLRSSIKNVAAGVYACNSGTNYTVNVKKTDFELCGIATNIVVTNNFNFTENSVKMFSSDIFSYGIYMGLCSENSSGYKVEGNNFYSTNTSAVSGVANRGICVTGSGNDYNSIYRNTFDKLNWGIRSDDNPGLQFQCNEFSSSFGRDIYIISGISSSQGSCSKSAGNKFTSGVTNISMYNSNAMTYYYSGNNDPSNVYYPSSTVGSITKTGNITANDCGSTICINNVPILSGHDDSDGTDIALYESLQQIYESRLAEYNNAGYGFLLENFEENDADIVAVARQKQDTLISIRRTMAEIANRNIDAILQDTVIFDREALNGWYNRINTQTAKYSLVNSYFEMGEYALARQELATIPQRFALTTDELAEYDNFCQYQSLREAVYTDGRNYAQLTEDEIAELQVMVERNTGVSSAYANSVLCFFYGICRDEEIDIDFDIDAPMNSKSTTEVVEENAEPLAIYVYPNPADEELNILLNSLPEGKTMIEFHDVTGRLVLSEEIKSANTSINISSLKQGVYMYRIVNGDNVIARDRIVKE